MFTIVRSALASSSLRNCRRGVVLAARPMLNPTAAQLGKVNALLSGVSRGGHHVRDFPGPLSLKAVVRGEAWWRTGEGAFRVDRSHAVVLNAGQRYSLTTESSRYEQPPTETLVACFRAGFVEDIARTRVERGDVLLDDPATAQSPFLFQETLRPLPVALRARLLRTRAFLRAGETDPLALDELFLGLAEEALNLESRWQARARSVPAVRAATRLEILRRVGRARDFIEAELTATTSRLTLARIARAACLSPYHCHRSFLAVFGETPRRYVARRRLERAHELLATTGQSVTEVCLSVGFSSLGSFSASYRRRFGVPPSERRTVA